MLASDGPAFGREHARELRRPNLTPREREVLEWLVAGSSIQQIADQLDRSPKTIDKHRGVIYRKLGASNRADLVREVRGQDLARGTWESLVAVAAAFEQEERRSFDGLVVALAEQFGVPCCGLGRNVPGRFEPLVVARDGVARVEPPYPAGAPWDTVLRLGRLDGPVTIVAPTDVGRQWRGFLGVRLSSRTGEPVGVLWIADQRPIDRMPQVERVLLSCAPWVARELGAFASRPLESSGAA